MGSQLSWYLARAGGLMSWWLLSATTTWGLLVSSRVLGARARSGRLLDLHRYLSGLSLVFLGLHLGVLFADNWVQIGLTQVLIPFTSGYRPAAVAWGVIAFYLLVAIQVTSVLRARIPHRWWRVVHASAFALFALVGAHALTAGTDRAVVAVTALAVGSAAGFLTLYRLLIGRRPQARVHTTAVASPAVAVAPGPHTCPVEVAAVRKLAEGVIALELVSPNGELLAVWEPGAHLDLWLPSGLVRQYSLCGDPTDRRSYQVAISWVDGGTGGPAEVRALTVGQQIAISGPRNTFPLVLAGEYLFIAGGIGITAILPMLAAADAAGHRWRLLYGGRTRAQMAFLDDIAAYGPDRVALAIEDDTGLPDLAAALAATGPGAAVYACGPEPMLAALEELASSRFPGRHLHTERFAAPLPEGSRPVPAGENTEFKVELRRSGQILTVPTDRSLLEVIRAAVPTVASSCEQGFCGTCALPVLDGIPEHRDSVLKPSERGRRDVIYPCISRAQTATLVIDL